jgi:hypothetical protein
MRNLEGQKFGRLVAMEPHGSNKHGAITWRCDCECGNSKVVVGFQLTNGKTKSCGCLREDVARNMNASHGMSKTPTYRAWTNMISRCYNEKVRSFAIYGALGVRVCDDWLESFESFYADMGSKPAGKSLDRIDSDGDYKRENCRWATASQQAANRGRPVNNTSGEKNVVIRHGKFIVQVRAERTLAYSGVFNDLELAQLVAEEARNKFHKHFANHK